VIDPAEGTDDPPHVVEDDLGQSELIESAGMQNSIAVAGPAALAMVPVAWVLTALGRAVQKLRRR
jgi:hypothetical protein